MTRDASMGWRSGTGLPTTWRCTSTASSVRASYRQPKRASGQSITPVFEGTDYSEGMRGIADGAGPNTHGHRGAEPALRIAVLPVRRVRHARRLHLIRHPTKRRPKTGTCSIGQNWDWIPDVRGAVVHTTEPDGLETLSFTEAGIVGGKIGLNSAGVGLAINGLVTTVDDWSRREPPFHMRCYNILRSRDLAHAQQVVSGTRRACSTNFVLAQAPDQVIDLEAAPDSVRQFEPEQGLVVHANHFLEPELLGVTSPQVDRRPHSHYRQARLRTLLEQRSPVTCRIWNKR